MEFAEYVAARRTSLVRTVVLLGYPIADAEDIVQAALLRAYRHWRKVERADQPEAYVYTILLNTLRDARRRRWHGEVPTESLPEAAVEHDATVGLAVRRALARLGEDQRAVLVLRFYAGLSEQETADALRIAPGTVKSRTSRAIAALSKDPELAEPIEEADDAH